MQHNALCKKFYGDRTKFCLSQLAHKTKMSMLLFDCIVDHALVQ